MGKSSDMITFKLGMHQILIKHLLGGKQVLEI